jgi:hypothetical protein
VGALLLRRARADKQDDAEEELDDDRDEAATPASSPSSGPAASSRPPASSSGREVLLPAPPSTTPAAPRVPRLPAGYPKGRLTTSVVRGGQVAPSPSALLARTWRVVGDPSITLDDLAGARLAASELGKASLVELACVVDVELNRAERDGLSLYDSLTRGQLFGRAGKGSRRPASTAHDARFRHLWVARAVLAGHARGISRGAVRFFDPEALDYAHRAWVAKRSRIPATCDALGLLDRWAFDRRSLRKGRDCPTDQTTTGPDTQAWVGAIDGVDPYRLMLMRHEPLGRTHTKLHLAATTVINAGRARALAPKGR